MSDANDNLIDVQIDGTWHKVPKGTRMIEAIRMARGDGTTVPHYCYHPKLSAPGNCRMCLVEMGMPPRLAPGQEPELDEDGYQKISWMPRAAIACANTVAPNMGIRTNSKLADECRKGVMEFLLINHPLDCPICDQAGECRLQEFSVEYGQGESRFKDQKVQKPKNVDIGERIVLDDERCIMCSRCIRFCDEIADDDVLGFTERGSYTTLTTHPGKRLDNNYSLNTVDICPVGALTSKDFRFQMRTWFLKETKSIDVNCGTGANITIHSRENKVYRVTPRQNDAVNSCWMPDSHRLSHHQIDSPLRLTDPLLKRPNGEHNVTVWNTALEAAAAELRNIGGENIAMIASGRMTNEELFMAKRLAAALGIPAGNIDIVPRSSGSDTYLISDDRNPNTEGAKTVLGLENPGGHLASIRGRIATGQLTGLITWGEDLLTPEAGFSAHQLRGLKLHVAAFTHANPTAKLAHVVLPHAMAAEKRGSMINVTGRLQRLDVAVFPPAQARDDWEVLRDLTSSVGGGNGLYLIEDVFKSMAADIAKFANLSLGKIGDQGIQLYETGTEIPLLAREAARRASGVITG